MSAKLSLKAWLARPAEALNDGCGSSDDREAGPTHRYMLSAMRIEQPVTVAKTLRGLGLSLRRAHDALNRLAARETVVERLTGEGATVTGALAAVGVAARPFAVDDSVLDAGLTEQAGPDGGAQSR